MHRVASTGNTGTAGRARKERRLTFICRDSDDAKHCSGVNALQLAADRGSDRVLFSGSRDGTIKRWDLKGGQVHCAATLESHVDWVNDLVVIKDDLLVSCSSDTTIKVWRGLSSGECVKTFRQHRDYVTALAPAPKTNLVASAGLRNEIFVWDLEAGLASSLHPTSDHDPTPLPTPAYSRPAQPAQPPATGSSSSNGFSAAPESRGVGEGGYRPLEVSGSKDSVYALAMNDTATLLISGGTEKLLRVWDPRTGGKQWKLRGHTDNVKALLMDPTGRLCLSASSDAMIRLWDVGQQRCISSFAVHTDSVWALAADPSFRTVYSGGRDGCLYMTHLDSKESVLLAGGLPPVLSLALQVSDNSLWVGSTSSTISCWPAREGGCTREALQASSFLAGSLSLARVRSSADAATAPVPLYSKTERVIPGSPGIVQHTVMNDKRHVLTNDSEGTVKLWEVTSGRVVKSFGKVKFDEKEKELFVAASVPSWFTMDTRLGSLALHLDTPACFSAEMYACDLVAGVGEEKKLNLGLYTLKGLFLTWQHKRRALDDTLQQRTLPEDPNPNPNLIPDPNPQLRQTVGLDEDATIPDLPEFTFSSLTPPSILTEGSHSGPWRKKATELSGGEGSSEIPWWCIEAVLHDKMPPRDPAKCSFLLLPHQGTAPQSLAQGKLSAPRILRIHKVLTYVNEKLGMDPIPYRTAPTEGCNGPVSPPSGPQVQILCNDEVLSPDMSLATVRAYIWKKPGDLELRFRIVQGGEAQKVPEA